MEEKGGGRDREKGPKKQKKPQSDISSNLNPKLLSEKHIQNFSASLQGGLLEITG